MLPFDDSETATELADRVQALVDEVVIPRDRELRGGAAASEGTILDLREEARVEVSMAKVRSARVTQQAIDTAVQYCGANGIGTDLPLADFYESVRTFQIVDGADEVHLRTIAREAVEEVDEQELEPVVRYDG